MDLDTLAALVVIAGTIPATLFPIVYAFSRWHTTMIGQALMVKAIGLMLLFNLSVFGDLFAVPEWLAVAVVVLVVIGIYYQFTALVVTRFKARRESRRWAFSPREDDEFR